jgi:hypothetical protein
MFFLEGAKWDIIRGADLLFCAEMIAADFGGYFQALGNVSKTVARILVMDA